MPRCRSKGDELLRIGILGCGSIGRRHARNLTALGQTDLVLFDPDPAARTALEGSLTGSFVETLDGVWRSHPEIIFVTSPPHLHVQQALEAARSGCDLFIEKPLSHAWDGVDELCAEIEKRGLVSMVGCNMRFHPGPARVRDLLAEGAIGSVIAARIHTGSYLPDWRPGTDYRRSYSASDAMGGGAILDSIHEIDLALWYFGPGRLLAAAAAPANAIGLDVEGVAEILIRHDSGALSSVHVNFVQRDYRRGCEAIGWDGTLYWDFSEGRVRCVRSKETSVFLQPPGWMLDQMYRDELAHFLGSVARRDRTVNTAKESLPALRIALAAREMSRQHPVQTRIVA